MPAERPLAIGLVHRPDGTPSADRSWGRALVVRHARDARLSLIDIYELDDDEARNNVVLARLADLAIASGVRVLVTESVHLGLATKLADELALRHEPVPPRHRIPSDPW